MLLFSVTNSPAHYALSSNISRHVNTTHSEVSMRRASSPRQLTALLLITYTPHSLTRWESSLLARPFMDSGRRVAVTLYVIMAIGHACLYESPSGNVHLSMWAQWVDESVWELRRRHLQSRIPDILVGARSSGTMFRSRFCNARLLAKL